VRGCAPNSHTIEIELIMSSSRASRGGLTIQIVSFARYSSMIRPSLDDPSFVRPTPTCSQPVLHNHDSAGLERNLPKHLVPMLRKKKAQSIFREQHPRPIYAPHPPSKSLLVILKRPFRRQDRRSIRPSKTKPPTSAIEADTCISYLSHSGELRAGTVVEMELLICFETCYRVARGTKDPAPGTKCRKLQNVKNRDSYEAEDAWFPCFSWGPNVIESQPSHEHRSSDTTS
jgi:hypothetical protein